ncbi:hypothetical protein [Bacteroides rodentium]
MNIHDLLSQVIGKRVVHSRTGGGAGSIWNLEFEEDMYYMIWCSWRVEHNGIVLTTCTDDATPLVGRMNKSVEQLIGYKLLSYELSPHYDLTLYFENEFIVRVFCDYGFEADIREDYPDSNWYFCIVEQDISVTITNYFQLVCTKYYSNDLIEEQ